MCVIRIVSTGGQRSFNPPDPTPLVQWRAELKGSLPDGATIVWNLLDAGSEYGSVTFFLTPNALVTNVLARHPNTNRVRVRVVCAGDSICEAVKKISVPQWFQTVIGNDFHEDLAQLGLQGTLPNEASEDEVRAQKIANRQIFAEIIEEIHGTSVRASLSLSWRRELYRPCNQPVTRLDRLNHRGALR